MKRVHGCRYARGVSQLHHPLPGWKNPGNCHSCQRPHIAEHCTTDSFDLLELSDTPHGISITTRNWLLVSFLLFLPTVLISLILIIKVRDFLLRRSEEEAKDEEEEEEKDDEEER